MRTLLKHLIILISITFLHINLFADTTCSNTTTPCKYDVTAQQLADKISGVGITITNPNILFGEDNQVGTFSDAIDNANLEIDEGIILTTLSVEESFTTNNSRNRSITHAQANDNDLLNIDANAHFNTLVFEFDVTLDDNTRLLLVDYQFAAEEYNEYVGTIYNDAFGFFISGGDLNQTYNIARVIDNQTYVTVSDIDNYDTVVVNNVNNGTQGSAYSPSRDSAVTTVYTNSAYFIDNDQNNNGGSSPVLVEYDGLTHTLHATLDNLTPGETYHFKMAIADSSDAQLNTGVFVNKISGLREPSICYDYAYKQNGLYLTAGYDASKGPYIDADVVANNPALPIDVAMYFRNTKASEIVASNITLDVIDINTSQATYTQESVYVTEPNSVFQTKINDVDLNVSNEYVKEIPITSFDAFEYFYMYFSLNPKVENLSLPIVARITYDLTIPLSLTDSLTIHRSSIIDQDVPICNSGNPVFQPVYGNFNVIENSLYTDDTNYFYNINTQVTGRKGDLSVVAVDNNITSNSDLHKLKSVTTVVGVDMLDLKAFHDTSASCSENSNSISKRVWIVFDNTSKTDLDTGSINFNALSRENATLRISYLNDGNGDLLDLEAIESGGETRWNVKNFSTTVQSGQCLTDIALGTDTVAQWCSNEGTSFASAMTKDDLDTCMECVYGYDTQLVCARDNFAIRPEALNMHIYDQNLSDPSLPLLPLTTNYSGVTAPINARLNLAADYSYVLEVNATNHFNNTPSMGYNTELTTRTGTSSKFLWAPSDPTLDPTQCNDISDHNFTTKFVNGTAQLNASLIQVGDYTLQMEDTVWTQIDSVQQAHHTGTYFILGSDCTLNSNNVANEGSPDSLNGCEISSNHISSSDTNLIYNDYNISFHPYQFNITNSFTFRRDDINTSGMSEPDKPFVYMNNLTDDETMSVHLNTTITTRGKETTSILSNYVSGCYAKPLNIHVDKTSPTNSNIAYNYIVHNKDSNNTTILAHDINTTVDSLNYQSLSGLALIAPEPNFATTSAFFQKDQNGTIQLQIYENHRRDVNVTANPQDIQFLTLTVDDNATLISADFKSNYYAQSDLNITQRVLYYYGKTVTPRITVVCNRQPCKTGIDVSNDNNIKLLISYAIFCDATVGTCNTTNLPIDANQVSDIRWFENRFHDFGLPLGTDGQISIDINATTEGNVTEVVASGNVREVNRAISRPNYETEVVLEYNGPLPYDAVMQMESSPWLIYNEDDENATVNQFIVQFVGNGGWSGKHEDNTSVKTNASTSTNRRIMW
ncbi:MAG: choice-of-anchor L domain-containing protein [Sulfurimonas sp.]|nr:choice-of-anchor L domain-containing protein [Sulfurimonas sp.]